MIVLSYTHLKRCDIMKKRNGFVATISIFSCFTFFILLISYAIYGINQYYNNNNYVIKKVNDKINNKDTFVNSVRRIRN